MNHQTSFTHTPILVGFGCLAMVVAGAIWTGTGRAYSMPEAQPAAAALSIEGLPLGKNYPYRSPLAIAVSSKDGLIYAAEHTGQCVDIINLGSQKIVRSIPLAGAPSGIALDAKQNRLFVTYGSGAGGIAVIDTQRGTISFTLPAGFAPIAPVVSADSQTLYVCNRFDNEVAAYDLKTRTVRSRVSVAREPIAAARTPDDKWLIVAHHLPAQAADSNDVAAVVDFIAIASFGVAATVQLPNGSTGLRDVCVSPDGRYAYIPHTLGRFGVPTTQLDRGWMNTSALSIIDLNKRTWLTTVLLDDVDRGAANPWGAVCSEDGRWLVVSHSGTHELSIIDRQALHARIDRVAAGQRFSEVSVSLNDIPNDLSFLAGLRRRVPLSGKGPRGLAMAGKAVVAAEYFSDSLAWVELGEDAGTCVKTIALSEPVTLSDIRRGEIAFYDATLCFQQWQSCASCHPDARADALNWDLMNDGIGNPKNSRSMLYTHVTPPVMITGIRPNAETAVRAGFRFIQFAMVTDEKAAAVDAYLKALQPAPSPVLDGGKLSVSAMRGKTIFEQARCGACHTGKYYTDGKPYDIELGPDQRGIRKFDTPTLVEVWRTAPYLYDGRAKTIEEVLTIYNLKDMHGKTSDLSKQEIADLTAFILSL
jgi:DNA-binding beta-propeller fold protein YncE/cytochrome c peroxidase